MPGIRCLAYRGDAKLTPLNRTTEPLREPAPRVPIIARVSSASALAAGCGRVLASEGFLPADEYGEGCRDGPFVKPATAFTPALVATPDIVLRRRVGRFGSEGLFTSGDGSSGSAGEG